MVSFNLEPDSDTVQQYYASLKEYENVGARHEGAVRTAFRDVLVAGGRQVGWTLVPEWSPHNKRIRLDGAFLDDFRLTHGFWEAKDSDDDLDREIRAKLDTGYPTKNTIFQEPNRAVLMQDGGIVFDANIRDPKTLVDLLKHFFAYKEPAHEEWEQAVADFKERVPELGKALTKLIERELEENRAFRTAFQDFYALCKQAINPNLSKEAVEEMLIQHLLTERLFRRVFDNSDFVRRNVIASEIEKVIDALTSRSFSRRDFLKKLDRFYVAIEDAAGAAEDFAEKQAFLNTIYEQFFQGFAVDVADTHGIVYTPQPIVDFMVNSVKGLVKEEFGVGLADENVHIMDPFVGTGNFIVRTMQELSTRSLPMKYGADGRPELHCNEVMLLPYYIASMNIEHEYYSRVGRYEPYTGICLVDTFETEDQKQRPQLFSKENTERVKRQQEEKITVIIGNPPYNAWQVNANDNNQNRTYEHVDTRIRETFAKDSSATLKNALYDPYAKAIRWATDRIGESGIVAFVTNNSFVDNIAFDGMRKHLAKDFDEVYVLDCGGNVRKNPKLSGTTHNVFGIQVGVSINLFVKRTESTDGCAIHYHRLGEFLRKEERFEELDKFADWQGVNWDLLEPDGKYRWLVDPQTKRFESFIPIGSKSKGSTHHGSEVIFDRYSNGVKTSKNAFVYDFRIDSLSFRMRKMISVYNQEVDRWANRANRNVNIANFLISDNTKVKWTRELRRNVQQGNRVQFSHSRIKDCLFRPYVRKKLYYDEVLLNRAGPFTYALPQNELSDENRFLWIKEGSGWSFFALAINQHADLLPQSGSQCFPFYVYDEDGTDRRENITDWALAQFREQYQDDTISKWDIFHYVYSVLHHPEYRECYAGNLKRQLPRIPFAPDLHAFAEAGRCLAELHVGYEDADEYDLEEVEAEGEKMEWRVEKMRWREEKTAIRYNDFLTLRGIPKRAHRYRLGNRSALEWLVDQYRVRHYKRYDITHNPNNPDDKWYIVRLIKKVTTVSLETVEVVEGLGELGVV